MLSEEQRDELRGIVISQLTAIYRPVRDDIDEALVASLYAPDPTDEAEEGMLDELASQLDEHALQDVHRLEDTLVRLGTPGFGRCVDCGEEIPFARLKAAPWVERCAADQERFEELQRVAGEAPPTF